jgi:hypothetical protein
VTSTDGSLGREDGFVLAAIGLLWLLALAVIGLAGEFPLNDDWAYARAVFEWIETGALERLRWTWVPAWTHFAFGGLFAFVLGPTFLALRLSTLVMAALTAFGTHLLARRAGATPLGAGVAAAAVAFCPLVLNLSVTYMTDVPFAAACVFSLVFFVDAARRPTAARILFALAATLNRQPGLALPIAFGVACIAVDPKSPRRWLVAGVAAVVVVGAHFASERILLVGSSNLYTVTDVIHVFAADTSVMFHVLRGLLTSGVYLGVLLSPVVLLAVSGGPRWLLGAAVVGAALAVAAIVPLRAGLPPGLNIVWDLGLGPLTAFDPDAPPHGPRLLWWLLVALGGASSGAAVGLVLGHVLPRLPASLREPGWVLPVAFAAGYLAPHVLRAPFFDRYLVAVTGPLAAALVAFAPASPWRRGVSAGVAACLAGLLLVGTAGTRDYLERHRVKHALASALIEEGVSEHLIDAGVEFVGFHTYRIDQGRVRTHGRFDLDDVYVISYGPEREGYRVAQQISRQRWMPWGDETVYLLVRESGPRPRPWTHPQPVRPGRSR